MKNRNLFLPLIVIQIIGFILLAACKKDQPVQLHDEDKKDPVDSGSYNPNHYLPMKMGAYWEYLHDNGKIEKVICSERFSYDDTGVYNYRYEYKAHRLKSDYPYADLPKIEPVMNGSFISDEFSIFRPFVGFCQKSKQKDSKILDVKFGELRYQRIYDCPAGPTPLYYSTCLDTSTSIDNFPEVAVVLYSRSEAFQSSLNPNQDMDTDPYKLLEPLIIEGNPAYSVSWFAKGVGLIRRDIYENQVLVDRMRLVKYYFP
ncbi:MAG TPA: hypothetical protein DIW47_05850 [Bacteroidetes bacterium]|nr:hypothetical protein [Bacteroidota bacterium]